MQDISKDTCNIIIKNLEGGFYSQVVRIRLSIQKNKVVKEHLVEDKYHNNENEINTQNEDGNYIDSDLVKYKEKTQLIESTEDTKKEKSSPE